MIKLDLNTLKMVIAKLPKPIESDVDSSKSIKIKTVGSDVIFEANDFQIYSKVVVTNNSLMLEDKEIYINSIELSKCINAFSNKDREIELNITNTQLILKGKRSRFILQAIEDIEILEYKDDDLKELNINFNLFNNIVSILKDFSDTNNPSIALNGIFFGNGNNAVATNTRVLIQVSMDDVALQEDFIFPKFGINILKTISSKAKIFINNRNIVFKDFNNIVSISLLNAKFPAYQRVIKDSDEFIYTIVLNSDALEELRSALNSISKVSRNIEIIFSCNGLVVKILDSTVGAKITINTKIPSLTKEVSVRLDADGILKSIKNLDKVFIFIDDDKMPIKLLSNRITTVLMQLTLY
jgi:LysM repeat protein